MMVVRAGKAWLSMLRQHSKIGVPAFILGTAGALTLGTFWPKHYTGSVLIAPDLQAALQAMPQDRAQRESKNATLQQVSSRQDWAGTVTRFKLYPEIVAGSGLPRAAEYLASQVSMESVATPDLGGGEAVRLSYTGQDRDLVAGVTEAIADGFTKPAAAAENPPSQASAQPVDEPLYAPVVLPTPVAPPAPTNVTRQSRRSLRTAKNRSRRSGHSDPARAVSTRTSTRRRNHAATAQSSALLKQLQLNLIEGEKLKEASEQNAATLDDLRKQQQKSEANSVPAAAPIAPPPQRPIDVQIERLRQELGVAQHKLDTLRQRYTDQYPDVVIAREKVQDIQLDLSRLTATAARTAPLQQPQTRHARVEPPVDPAALAAQIRQAEAAQTNLSEAIARNQNETVRLEAAVGAEGNSKAGGTSPSVSDALAMASQTEATPQSNAGPLNDSVSADNLSANKPSAPDTTRPALPATAPFFMVRQTTITTTPFFFARNFLWPLSLVFGFLAALAAAWLAEQRDPSIRNEGMLLHELPPSAVYLGGIPRIRHEVVAD